MFKVKLNSNLAVLPKRATAGSAGYDICSAHAEPVVIKPGKMAKIKTDLSISIPRNYYARIASRSGLCAKFQVCVMAGVIDSDYRGEIMVLLMNFGDRDYEVKPGDRIAQMIFEAIETPELVVTEGEIDEADEQPGSASGEPIRGKGGFGSTGF